jgi:hypothetical protein
MNEVDKSAWCRSHGAYPKALAKWCANATTALAASEDLRASPQATRQDPGVSCPANHPLQSCLISDNLSEI